LELGLAGLRFTVKDSLVSYSVLLPLELTKPNSTHAKTALSENNCLSNA